MLYVIHDEEGRIEQANKVYFPKGYDDQLNDLGLRFIKLKMDQLPASERMFVENGALVRRPEMALSVNKHSILVGENDAVVIDGIPQQSRLSIHVEGHESVPLHTEILNETSLEFSAPAPGVYLITFEKFPFVTKTVRVEAHEAH